MPGNTRMLSMTKTQEDLPSLWRPTQRRPHPSTDRRPSTRTPQGMNVGGHRAIQPHSIHCSPAPPGCWLRYHLLPPHDSFNKHFPSTRSGSQGLGGGGKEVDSEYPPPTGTGRPIPELSPAGTSGSLSLRSSIPQPTGRTVWAPAASCPGSGDRRACCSCCRGQAASLLCPRAEGSRPCPVEPRGRREESRNLPPHWKQREPRGWGTGLGGRLVTLSPAVSFF